MVMLSLLATSCPQGLPTGAQAALLAVYEREAAVDFANSVTQHSAARTSQTLVVEAGPDEPSSVFASSDASAVLRRQVDEAQPARREPVTALLDHGGPGFLRRRRAKTTGSVVGSSHECFSHT